MNDNEISIMLVSKGKEPSRYYRINLKFLKSVLFVIILVVSFFSFSYGYKHSSNMQVPGGVVAVDAESRETPAESETGVNGYTSKVLDELLESEAPGNSSTNETAYEQELSERLKRLQEKLLDMEQILNKKGIKKELSIGGKFIDAQGLDMDHFELLESDIESLVHVFSVYPIGKPAEGSVSSGFGYRADPFNRKRAFHSGIDLAAPKGGEVVSTADGVVEKSGWCDAYGKCIVIRHAHGYKTLYAHLSAIEVSKGDKVTSGQLIGRVGSTGRSTGPHLHYEIFKNGKRINPAKYITLG